MASLGSLYLASALVFFVSLSSVVALELVELGDDELGDQLGDDEQWEAWKGFYGKRYETVYEENYRKAIWRANLQVRIGLRCSIRILNAHCGGQLGSRNRSICK